MTEMPSLPPAASAGSASAKEEQTVASKGIFANSRFVTLSVADIGLSHNLFHASLFTLAGDILEHAFLLSVLTKDDRGLERHYAQLQPYYSELRSSLPESV